MKAYIIFKGIHDSDKIQPIVILPIVARCDSNTKP